MSQAASEHTLRESLALQDASAYQVQITVILGLEHVQKPMNSSRCCKLPAKGWHTGMCGRV